MAGIERQVAELDLGDGIDQVRVVFTDYNGIARARSLRRAALASALQHGVNFSSPTVDFNSQEQFPPDPAFDPASPDIFARPVPATYRELSITPDTGIVLSDLVDGDREPWAGCPRAALRRQVERAEGLGLRFRLGFEPEGYVLRPGNPVPEPAGETAFATLDGLDRAAPFVAELLGALDSVGLTADQWSEEYGPGQIEVNLRYGDALAAADGMVLYKYLFRAVARRHGLIGTFMPKPFGDRAGSGLHVHLSAVDIETDRPMFADPAGEFGLSDPGRHALAGLLAHGEALMAVAASTVNSYKRFLPGSWAPTSIMYAYASRAAFVRIPDSPGSRRLEFRPGDGAGNPYLFATALLAAMLDGIDQRLDPGPPVAGDVSLLSPADLVAAGARPLPATLGQALDALERDEALGSALGPIILAEFLKVKRSEWDAFCRHVGHWDREWYLTRY